MSAPDPVDILAAGGVLSAVPRAALARLVAACPVEAPAPGALLMEQGVEGDFALAVLAGDVRIEVSGDLGTAVVARLGPGELVGELAAVAGGRRTASVRAGDGLRVLRLERTRLMEVLADAPDLALAVIAALARRLDRVNEAVSVMTRAATALADGSYTPDMLDALNRHADRLSHFAEAFRDMAAEMVEKRTASQEMQTAAAIQRAFLPGAPPQGRFADRVEIAALMEPARNVGGDFYDYFLLDERRLGFAVGDVSGKGTPAAMFMSVARTVLKTVAREGATPGAVLERVNDLLAEDNAEGMFVTLAYGVIDLGTGWVQIAQGGHEEVLVLGSDGRLDLLAPTGPALGLFEGRAFSTHARTLRPGDRLIVATDGVTEAFDPDRAPYGWDRLRAALQGNGPGGADATLDRLRRDVAAFVRGAPASDDLTVLALRYRGASGD